jgi:hypothetical protein
MMEWDLGRAIVQALAEARPGAPVSRLAARAALAAIEKAGWRVVEMEKIP